VISVEFPSILDGLKFPRLLYRGTRDGFSSASFHRHCDRQGGTLTLIRSVGGSVFGGFTPVVWDSKSGHKNDDTHSSFLFTLINSHGTKPKRFPLKSTGGVSAILCFRNYGPSFGGDYTSPADLCIRDKCDSKGLGKGGHCSAFGTAYENTTGLPGRTFLAGESEFLVKEIEVFHVG
jgi:hypothetical protein